MPRAGRLRRLPAARRLAPHDILAFRDSVIGWSVEADVARLKITPYKTNKPLPALSRPARVILGRGQGRRISLCLCLVGAASNQLRNTNKKRAKQHYRTRLGNHRSAERRVGKKC